MKKFFKVLFFVIMVLILGVLGGGYYFLKTFDLNEYKKYAEDLASKELGRKLTINGEASLGISLIPTLVINDVELANAPWAHYPQMVKVKQLKLEFALLPLLQKQVIINNITLSEPEVYLEVSAEGKENWVLGAEEKAAAKSLPEPQLPQNSAEEITLPIGEVSQDVAKVESSPANALIAGFAAKNVTIQNAILMFDDLQSGSQVNVGINTFNLSMDSMDAPISLDFDVTYDHQPIVGQAVLGSVNDFLKAENPYAIDVNVKAYQVQAKAKGVLNNILSDISYDLAVNVYNPAGNFEAPEATLIADLSGNTQNIHADISSLTVAGNVIAGMVEANIGAAKPYIKANLNSAQIDLQSFSPSQPMALNLPDFNIIGTVQASQLVPDEKVPYEVLNTLNADVVLNVKNLIVNEAVSAQNVALTTGLKNGVLKVNPLVFDFGQGNIDAQLSVDSKAQKIVLKLNSKNILLQDLHKEFVVEGPKDFGIKSGGQTQVFADVTTQGATYRQLVQNLNGQVVTIVGESVVNTGSLRFLTGNVLTQLLSMIDLKVNKNPEINLQCAVVRTDLSAGKAKFPQSIAIQSKQLSLVSDGVINMVNDNINFTVTPSFSLTDTNVAQALSSFIKINGTLDNPKIAIDEKQALQTLVGVATTGPAFIGSQMVLDSSSSPCWTALKNTPFANQFPAPSKISTISNDAVKDSKAAVKDAGKQIEKSVRDIRDNLKTLFKSF